MKYLILNLILLFSVALTQKIIIPMDNSQNDHLKAYGLSFWILKQNDKIDWLLNYKGGSFLINAKQSYIQEAKYRGITYHAINVEELNNILII